MPAQAGSTDDASQQPDLGRRRCAIIVYMLSLGEERARHAIADLGEFEPEEAERTIVILIKDGGVSFSPQHR